MEIQLCRGKWRNSGRYQRHYILNLTKLLKALTTRTQVRKREKQCDIQLQGSLLLSDLSDTMSRVYVGNLDPRVSERDLEDEFRKFGVIKSVWVARRPPGYAFIDFDDKRDAEDAIKELDGHKGWRVEMSRNSRGGGGGGGRGGGRGRFGGSDLKCYECGEPGHFARECRLRIGSGRRRSRSPRYRRSPSYGRRSYSPRGRSPPRHRSPSPRGRNYSGSPPYRGREELPFANGNGLRDQRQSRS